MATEPTISILLIAYNMPREIPRTVQSFLPPYQRGLAPEEVEVLVLENGSTLPVPDAVKAGWPSNVRYFDVPEPRPSPARALNLGARVARGRFVCPCIDGARLASPGLLAAGLSVLRQNPDAFVASLGVHLGPKPQQISVPEGYNAETEDGLLQSIGWPENGEKLFDIAAPAGSAKGGWLYPIAESNAPLLSRERFHLIGGFEEAFDEPGGGLVNLDFYKRSVEAAPEDAYLIVGEATFHQVHGGVSTSDKDKTRFEAYAAHYEAIRGRPYTVPEARPALCGRFTPEATAFQERIFQDRPQAGDGL